MNFFNNSSFLLWIAAVAIIIFAIAITAALQAPTQPFSQVITVGPVWQNDSWTCTSDADFMIHGTIRALDDATLAIQISDLGTQALYSFTPEKMETFSVGATADDTVTLTKTNTVSGWITLQTTSDAKASCIQSNP